MTERQFRAHFGCSPRVCAAIWNRIDRLKRRPELAISALFCPSKLLWTLLFLRLYSCEDVLASMVRTTRKNFRKWIWYGIDVLGELDLVSPFGRSSSYSVLFDR